MGQYHRIIIPEAGTVFGLITLTGVIGRIGRHLACEGVCSCGSPRRLYQLSSLRSGLTRSCNCLRSRRAERVNGKYSVEYYTWQGIRQRCNRKSHPKYKDYGGRGIKVCGRWMESFDNFLADVGRRPPEKTSLDRWPDNNGDYKPGNVRWADAKQQNNNKRTSKLA